MRARFWALLGIFWVLVSASACTAAEGAYLIADFATARVRGCQRRMRRAIGLPPLPEIPARTGAGGEA